MERIHGKVLGTLPTAAGRLWGGGREKKTNSLVPVTFPQSQAETQSKRCSLPRGVTSVGGKLSKN